MANIFQFTDFENAARKSGLYDSFSQADLNLAMQNPDVGMSLLNLKQRYGRAATDEQRAQLNTEANNLRSEYGGYTGGKQGADFIKDAMRPADFAVPSAPTYQNKYASDIKNQYNNLKNYGSFSYDAASDPSYAAYQKAYAREGRRASADTMGQLAAMTGGMPSSYAATAGAQAGNYYAAQMADKVPQLYEAAYRRYLQEFSRQKDMLDTARNLENDDYAKYQDKLTQYDKDREFNYKQYLDDIEAQRLAEETRKQDAITAAGYGDYSQLANMGIDTDSAERAQKLNAAYDLFDKTGDVSALKEMGIDTTYLEDSKTWEGMKRGMERADWFAEKGDNSLLPYVGADPTYADIMRDQKIQAGDLSNQYTQAQITAIKNDMDMTARQIELSAKNAQDSNIVTLAQMYSDWARDAYALGNWSAAEAYIGKAQGLMNGIVNGADENLSAYLPAPADGSAGFESGAAAGSMAGDGTNYLPAPASGSGGKSSGTGDGNTWGTGSDATVQLAKQLYPQLLTDSAYNDAEKILGKDTLKAAGIVNIGSGSVGKVRKH